MDAIDRVLEEGMHNFVFLGEAGCGKSEIALNFAKYLQNRGDRPVHFFDMDMTKPLFRSRDMEDHQWMEGIQFHFEEQFYDAPTLVGGVRRLLRDESCYVVMDVGGDDIGARSVGGFMAGMDRSRTRIYYVLNAYRPWSGDIDHVDKTLGSILAVSHIGVDEIHLVNNPNLGLGTTAEDILEGAEKMRVMTRPYKPIDFVCVKEELDRKTKENIQEDILPLHLYLTYPWAAET